MYTGFEQREGE